MVRVIKEDKGIRCSSVATASTAAQTLLTTTTWPSHDKTLKNQLRVPSPEMVD